MSVIMTFRVQGDPDKLEQLAAENQGLLKEIAGHAKEHGATYHRFYGTDGWIMVLDEWPAPQNFQTFFESQRDKIEPMLRDIATSEPEITFWRKLETGDDIG